jgi:LmbE family N-acetylglucosaminyl deacetylase
MKMAKMSNLTPRMSLVGGRTARAVSMWLFGFMALAALLAVSPRTVAAQNRSILVVAPHPDDEALCCSGVIFSALQRGDSVKVAIVTNGDYYTPGVSLGYTREAESVGGMATLGVSAQNVIFMGYGDETLQDLYQSASPTSVITSAAGQTQTYANQGLGGISYHQYLYGSPGTYNRQTILGDMEALLQHVAPSDVYTTGLWDDHPDHRATFNFVVEALLHLKRQGVALSTRVHETLIHAPCSACGVPTNTSYMWPEPVFTPTEPFAQPYYLTSMTPYLWNQIERIEVPPQMQTLDIKHNLKAEAISMYPSQGEDSNPNLFLWGFVRKDEFFWIRDFSTNVAGLATVTASSENSGAGQLASSAVDGFIEGYPGYAPWEWVTNGELAGAWLALTWVNPVTISEVVLYNREDGTDDVIAGTLRFSDGSTVPVGQLPISGSGQLVSFPPKTVSSMRFTVDQAVGENIGLAEIEVFGSVAGNTVNHPQVFSGPVPSATIQTDQFGQPTIASITDAQTTSLTVSGFDVDAQPLSYGWTTDTGTISGTGTTAVLNPPVVAAATVIGSTVEVSDGLGGTTQNTVFVTVTPSNTSGFSVSSLVLSPANVASGNSAVGTVTLNGVAPRGAVVALSSSLPTIASVPATLTVVPGSNTASFSLSTVYVTATTVVTISASLGGHTQVANLSVLQPPVIVASVVVNPNTIGGGNSATGTITLSGPAPAGGAVIPLSNSLPAVATVPASVTVPAGASSVSFAVATSAVTSAVSGTLSASYVGQTVTGGFRVAPYVSPNLATIATVSVSSENDATQQQGVKAIDGILDGSPGDYTKEWATLGQLAGAWIQLTWSIPVTTGQVVLYDRPNLTDNVTAGTLSFSDGSTVSVGALPNNGSPLAVSFTPRTVTWMKFTVNSAVGQNIGLAELAVIGTVTPASAISAVTLNPATVTGGASAMGTVTLNGAAPAGGTIVALNTSNAAVATVPTSVTVPSGAMTATFSVATSVVGTPAGATLTASYNGTQTAGIVVVPVGYPAVIVSAITVNPATVGGGNSAVGAVVLNVPALPGGAAVALLSSATSVATTPASVTVPAGSSSATFTVTTQPVSSGTSITLSATYGGVTSFTPLRVAPYVAPNLATIATVTVSSENGATQQQGVKAIDGIVDGSPGDYTKEWATAGQLAGAWIQLTWSVPVTTGHVVLYDRPNLSDNITSGTLSFSDGSTVPVGTLPNDGSALTVSFTPKNVTWMRFTVGTAVGENIGLAEIAVIGSVAVASAVNSVTLSPTTVTGGASSTGTVTLNGVAPAGGTLVTLASNNASVASVPATVTVPSGTVTATFPVTTTAVSAQSAVTISANYNGTATATIMVTPVVISSLTLSPTMVTGGASGPVGTITLNVAAPAGGALVTLASGNPVLAAVPASVLVPAGTSTATFAVTTSAVTVASTAIVTATFNGIRSARLLVAPVLSGSGMQPFVSDNFNRANGGLGANWTTVLAGAASPAIQGGQVQSVWGRAEALYYGGVNWPADQYAEAEITGLGGGSIGPAVRMTSDGTFYAGTVGGFGNGSANVYFLLGYQGGLSVIASSSTATVLADDVLSLSVVGTTLTLTNVTRSTVLLTATDSTVSAGYPGFYIGGTGTTLTNWSAGLNTPPLGLTALAADSISRPNAPNLGSNWTIGPGLYAIQIVNGQMESAGQGQTPGQGHGKEYYTSVAFPSDQWSMAQVTSTTNDINGSIVRYQGSADTHYVGFVSMLGPPGTCSVAIDRDIGGQPSQLVSDSTYCSITSGDYVLMQAQGPLLSYIDVTTGALLLATLDTQITGGAPGWSLDPIGGTPTATNWSGGKFGE